MKKVKKYSKNLFVSLFILSIISMPFVTIVPRVEAQGFPLGGSSDLQGYIKGLAPAIVQLPLCKSKLKEGAGDMFGKIKGAFSSNKPKESSPVTNENQSLLEDSQSTGSEELNAVPVFSTTLNNTAADIKASAEIISTSTASIDKNDTCLKSIGRMVTKMLLQKLTASTVEWINHGFNGKPTFLTNEGDFWGNIARNEVLQFGVEISNKTLFPFGEDFMRAQAESMQRHFADNAQYSLDRILIDKNVGYTGAEFSSDFSMGGWTAWGAMTQVPANNPLGFQLMASQELNNRLQGTVQSNAQNIRDDIQRSMGFMSQKQCVDPYNLTQEENDMALAKNEKDANGNIIGVCREWKSVTPGSLIADAAIRTTRYPENQLLKSEDLNDAVAAILDALLNQFATKLFTESGFAGTDSQGTNGELFLNTNYSTNPTKVDQDFPKSLINSWLAENPDFDIRKDITQAMIDDQRIYMQKLQDQNDQLMTVIKTQAQATKLGLPQGYRGNYGLLPIIYQLDYCIPGPHPGFEEDARASLDKALSLGGTPVGSQNGVDKALGLLTKLDSYNPLGSVAGPTSASGTVSTILGLIRGKDYDENQVKKHYADIIENFAGLRIVDNDGAAPTDMNGVTIVLETMVDRYIQVVHNVYNPILMPDVTKEATNEFKKTTGYLQLAANNTERISDIKSVINQLNTIKTGISGLNPLSPTYEDDLKPYIAAFARISSRMVTGDDIAQADSLLQQIKDKEVYVYNELLKGSFGCEAILKWDPTRPPLPYGFIGYARYAYPLPILYDYNSYGQTNILPDPLYNSKINNPKSIFQTPNPSRYGTRSVFNGKVGLAGVTFGETASNGFFHNSRVWDEYTNDFCKPIADILGVSHHCGDVWWVSGNGNSANGTSLYGPTIIKITDIVNIFQEVNAERLESSLGIY